MTIIYSARNTASNCSTAKARGKKLGRRRKLDKKHIEHAKILLTNETGEAVASSLGVSRATLYRALANVK